MFNKSSEKVIDLLQYFNKQECNAMQVCQFCLYLNQIWYQNVPYITFSACQTVKLHVCILWEFLQVCEKRIEGKN